MPSSVGARRQGDEYQDVYGWFRALELLRPARKVWRVSIEDPTGGSFDDVTLRPEAGTSHAPQFAQVKFHVDESGHYSTKALIEHKSRNLRSLLQKAWDTWLVLREEDTRVQLLLVTTYSWDPADPIAKHIRFEKRLTQDFITNRLDGDKAAESRLAWWEDVGKPDEDLFQPFLASLQFRTGYPATSELMDWTSERMELVGLKHEHEDVLAGSRQVWEWIRDRKESITREDMQAAIEAKDLLDPGASLEPSVSLYIHTVVKEPHEIDGDWELDWRDHFDGEEWLRGHRVTDPTVWNEVMLPEVFEVRSQIMTDTECRLLRARGKARLSAWFAIGAVFSRVAGWVIEVDQGGHRWRNDEGLSTDVQLLEELEDRGGDPETLAVGISITGDLAGDVRAYLDEIGDPAGKLLLIQTNLGLGFTAVRDAGDLTAIAQLARDRIRTALGKRPRRVLLFYYGPLSGAAFIGSQLNGIAPEIQVYEDQVPGYAPSFTLRLN